MAESEPEITYAALDFQATDEEKKAVFDIILEAGKATQPDIRPSRVQSFFAQDGEANSLFNSIKKPDITRNELCDIAKGFYGGMLQAYQADISNAQRAPSGLGNESLSISSDIISALQTTLESLQRPTLTQVQVALNNFVRPESNSTVSLQSTVQQNLSSVQPLINNRQSNLSSSPQTTVSSRMPTALRPLHGLIKTMEEAHKYEGREVMKDSAVEKFFANNEQQLAFLKSQLTSESVFLQQTPQDREAFLRGIANAFGRDMLAAYQDDITASISALGSLQGSINRDIVNQDRRVLENARSAITDSQFALNPDKGLSSSLKQIQERLDAFVYGPFQTPSLQSRAHNDLVRIQASIEKGNFVSTSERFPERAPPDVSSALYPSQSPPSGRASGPQRGWPAQQPYPQQPYPQQQYLQQPYAQQGYGAQGSYPQQQYPQQPYAPPQQPYSGVPSSSSANEVELRNLSRDISSADKELDKALFAGSGGVVFGIALLAILGATTGGIAFAAIPLTFGVGAIAVAGMEYYQKNKFEKAQRNCLTEFYKDTPYSEQTNRIDLPPIQPSIAALDQKNDKRVKKALDAIQKRTPKDLEGESEKALKKRVEKDLKTLQAVYNEHDPDAPCLKKAMDNSAHMLARLNNRGKDEPLKGLKNRYAETNEALSLFATTQVQADQSYKKEGGKVVDIKNARKTYNPRSIGLEEARSLGVYPCYLGINESYVREVGHKWNDRLMQGWQEIHEKYHPPVEEGQGPQQAQQQQPQQQSGVDARLPDFTGNTPVVAGDPKRVGSSSGPVGGTLPRSASQHGGRAQ